MINNDNINIGNTTGQGTTTINNRLQINGNLAIGGTSTYIELPDNQTNAFRFREGSNDYLQFRTEDGLERVVVWKDLYVVGNLDISGTTTTIDSTTLLVEDKNIELGNVSVPSDTTADGGGITLKATTDKTILYNNTSGNWETNIGLKVTGTLTATTGGSFDNEVYINGSDATTQRYLNFNRPTAGEYRATLRRDAWYLGETVQNIGDVTPTGANITLSMSGSATFAGTITSPFIRGSGADGTSADTALFQNTTSGGNNRIRINTYANGGGHPYIKFDAGGSNMVVGELYAGTTNNKLVLGTGEDPTGVTGISIDGNGNVTANNLALNQTNGAGATSTVLDHYEEGTWSPDFLGLSSAFTSYSNKVGTYVRIGSLVHIHGFIQLSGQPSFTTSTDYVRLGPLPFLASNTKNAGYNYTQGGVSCQAFNWHDNDYNNTGQVASGINNVRGIVKNSAITANDIIEFSLSYRVD